MPEEKKPLTVNDLRVRLDDISTNGGGNKIVVFSDPGTNDTEDAEYASDTKEVILHHTSSNDLAESDHDVVLISSGGNFMEYLDDPSL